MTPVRVGDTKMGDGGFIKGKNKLTSKFIKGDLKHFFVFPLKGPYISTIFHLVKV